MRTGCPQKITYEEYLPALLGHTLPAYNPVAGYSSTTDPRVSLEFFTVGHRLWDTAAVGLTKFLGDDGLPAYYAPWTGPAAGTIIRPQDNGFYRGPLLRNHGSILYTLKSMISTRANEFDTRVEEVLRTWTFPNSGVKQGFDFAAQAIQMGRDHGIPDYNTLRAAYGLPRVKCVPVPQAPLWQWQWQWHCPCTTSVPPCLVF